MVSNITSKIKYIGVDDLDIDLFESQYDVPNGMSYNSYVVLDDKITVFDSVDARFGSEWLANVKAALNGKTPDACGDAHYLRRQRAGLRIPH